MLREARKVNMRPEPQTGRQGGGARWPKLRPRVDSEGASLKNSLSNAIYVKKKSR